MKRHCSQIKFEKNSEIAEKIILVESYVVVIAWVVKEF